MKKLLVEIGRKDSFFLPNPIFFDKNGTVFIQKKVLIAFIAAKNSNYL